jgi:hypothetical protein
VLSFVIVGEQGDRHASPPRLSSPLISGLPEMGFMMRKSALT